MGERRSKDCKFLIGFDFFFFFKLVFLGLKIIGFVWACAGYMSLLELDDWAE